MSQANYLPLPVTVDEITAEWLTQAMRQRAEAEAVNTANCARVSAAMLDHDTVGVVASL